MNPHVERWIEFENSDGDNIRFPIYKLGPVDEGGVPKGWCAGYARRVANNLFGRNYEPNSAWNFRYEYESIPIEGLRDLRSKFKNKILTPGDLIGLYYPDSELNGVQRDKRGRISTYTHMAVFLGENVNNLLVFGQQVTDLRGIITDIEILREKSKFREIIKDIKISK
ncbi:hypothetical protein COU60_01920 [Candidatus Pacearchaeota archaeon CG10_big_fil_rev_8_21_14_0_10_34_76]|nr:MAG: hypothetical protein COU60_01920 [Candidatus Pacearchaeota archaeon CG10_big_fil_rev_8_21_14_0_10_34_76]